MAYIYFDDLKEILPVILSDWIEPGDEGWEWIFQEIEQKCYLGKKKKDKKKWKTNIELSMDNAFSTLLAQRNNINELTKKIETLGDKYTTLTHRVDNINKDVNAAKSMAEIAKNRTEVDYSKYSGKSDGSVKYSDYVIKADVIQNIYNRMANRGATRQELDTFRGLIHKYNALKAIIENNPEDKDCKTCKYYCDTEAIDEPCCACDEYQCWEAKKNG